MTTPGATGAAPGPPPGPLIDGAPRPVAGDRLESPSFARNFAPIRDALAPLIGAAQGRALELGSGPGRHAVALAQAYPALEFIPTDPFPAHRASVAAWSAEAGAANLRAPLALDAGADWAGQVAGLAPFTLVYAINVAHITPWDVTRGIVAGAGRTLAAGGWLALYGPFIEAGRATGPGNIAFDAHLRAQNPRHGVRALEDVDALARAAGLGGLRIARLPSDNLLVAWRAGG